METGNTGQWIEWKNTTANNIKTNRKKIKILRYNTLFNYLNNSNTSLFNNLIMFEILVYGQIISVFE